MFNAQPTLHTYIHIYIHAYRQTDRQTDRQADRHTHTTHTYTHTHTHTHIRARAHTHTFARAHIYACSHVHSRALLVARTITHAQEADWKLISASDSVSQKRNWKPEWEFSEIPVEHVISFLPGYGFPDNRLVMFHPSKQPRLRHLPATFSTTDRLVGLVVWRPPRERKIPGLNPACAEIFPGSSHTNDLKIGTPVATLQGAWRYRVSAATGRPGVSILWLGEMESLICSFYLSVAARKIVWADPSLRYTRMLLGR